MAANSRLNVSVVVFPGSNCDHDAISVYANVLKQNVSEIWYKERDLKNPDIVVIPGGFSFGDYLRTGALARVAPIMAEIKKFAEKGGPVLGICNGFQILCETGLLPGALLANTQRKFLSQFLHMKVENTKTPFTAKTTKGQIINCPVAHFEGNYFNDAEGIKRLEGEGQVVFRYCSAEGEVDAQNLKFNPNGAINAIAGICNAQGNVVGLMPHPERAAEKNVGFIGQASGLCVFESSLP